MEKQVRMTGDVPFVKLSNNKLKSLGWRFRYNSKQTIINSLKNH